MRRFTDLYVALDQTNATGEKVAAMARYFADAAPEDAVWAVWFLSGRRLKRLVKRPLLRQWVLEESGYPEWMLDECYQSVGDLAETIALLLPERQADGLEDIGLSRWVRERLMPLSTLDDASRAERVKRWWRSLPGDSRFVLNKLMTGALRVGVSQRLVVRALATHLGQDRAVIAHRLMGDWEPSAQFMRFLDDGDEDPASVSSMPYPFFLASPLQGEPAGLGDVTGWQAEWKWDGIRAQLIRRDSQVFIWSRGEERMDGRFPELERMAAELPDGTVLDGEILATDEAGQFSFAALQRRIGRRRPGRKMLAEVPVVFMAYDCLEWQGQDRRETPLHARRQALGALVADAGSPALMLSPLAAGESWPALATLREESRERGVEGLMLKARHSPYRAGRRRGDWWKWKVDPFGIDAVLLYAQPGSGRRSNLLTDYTFGVWNGNALVPVCKAYSGLTNAEIATLDRWIRGNTTERYGPVRAVPPTHVFEIAFDSIQASKRHASGVALRFPRIARWREDLAVDQADSLATVRELLATHGAGGVSDPAPEKSPTA